MFSQTECHRSPSRGECVRKCIVPVCAALWLLTSSLACHSRDTVFTRGNIEGELQSRTRHSAGVPRQAGSIGIPTGVAVEDGVSEDEAVALALHNNAFFQETLSELGISTARLFDAGLLTDPELIVLFPVGPKQLEFTAYTAIDAVWLRPIRIRAAELDLCRVGQLLVQNGLNTARDAQLAHADLLLAQERAALAADAATLRNDIAELARRRLAAGDISELEKQTAEIQAVQARIDSDRAIADVRVAQSRLRLQMGLALTTYELVATDTPLPLLPARRSEDLVAEALAMRPDLRGAELNWEAWAQRADVAHWQFMRFDAGIDANAEGVQGFEAGPAMRMSIPIFNGNRGQRQIAEAEQDRASRQFITIRNQIVMEVEANHALAVQATENLLSVREDLLPQVQETVDLAERNYLEGGTSYFLVLETTSQYLSARARELQLAADLRRSVAELERSVGHRLAPRSLPAAPAIQLAPPADAPNDDMGVRSSVRTGTFASAFSELGGAVQRMSGSGTRVQQATASRQAATEASIRIVRSEDDAADSRLKPRGTR